MAKRLVRADPNTRYRDLEGEAVLLHLGSGACFTLDPIGNRAWQLLSDLGDVDRVAAALALEFRAPLHVVRSDLEHLLDQLREKHLIDIDPA